MIGQRASILVVPDRGLAVAVAANANHSSALLERVTLWALEEHLGLARRRHRPLADQPPLAEYLGDYESKLSRITLRRARTALEISVTPKQWPPNVQPKPRPLPPARAEFVADDVIRVGDGPHADLRGRFVRDRRGRVQFLRFEGRLAVRA